MNVECSQCDGTGSLSRHLDGHLDCPHCDSAKLRANLNSYASQVSAAGQGRDWLIFQAGMAQGRLENA